jgi:hypothetical protein
MVSVGKRIEPIGLQLFAEILLGGFLDKTLIVFSHQLVGLPSLTNTLHARLNNIQTLLAVSNYLMDKRVEGPLLLALGRVQPRNIKGFHGGHGAIGLG